MKEFILLEDINNGELHVKSTCVTLSAQHAYSIFTSRGFTKGNYIIAEVVVETIDEASLHDLYDYMSL